MRRGATTIALVDRGSGAEIARDVAVASSFVGRLLGWIGRRAAPGAALWLPRTRAIHTFGVRGGVDALFLDGAWRVLGVRAGVRPWRTARGPAGTTATVELAPGEAARRGVRAGDRLTLRRTGEGGGHAGN